MTIAGTADALRTRDARARRVAQSRFEVPIALQAGAGTGKTTALVARVVAFCLGRGWERAEQALASAPGAGAEPVDDARIAARVASRVTAITFTEAAAAEMASRVGAVLSMLASGVLPEHGFDADLLPAEPLRARRATALVGAVDRMVVRTIHGWCHRLLSEHPIEAGLHPRFEVDADGAATAEVVQRVVQESLRSTGETQGTGDVTLERDGPAELAEMLGLLVEHAVTARELAEIGYTREHVDPVLARAREVLAEAEEAFAPFARITRKNTLAPQVVTAIVLCRRVLAEPLSCDADTLESLVATLRRAWNRKGSKRGNLEGKLNEWSKTGFGKLELKDLGVAQERAAKVVPPLRATLDQLLGWEPRDHERLRALLHPLLARVEVELSRLGIVRFDGLLRGAQRLLAGQESVVRRVRQSMDLLLVDEFQDTDPVQCDLIRSVALAGPRDARPSLFLVGDPQQSIFGWRSADLAAYDGMLGELLHEHGGEIEMLCVNHRSVQPILDEVARIAAPLLVAEPGVQAGFQPLLASRPETGFARDRFAVVEHWISADVDLASRTPAATRNTRAAEIEAIAVAREIRELHDLHGVAWDEVAIVFRTLGDAEIYLVAMRECGVPYDVAKDRSYYQRREVIEAAALVRCVIDPNDALALVAWLRSAAGGVPDAAWLPLWAHGFPERVAALDRPDARRLASLRAMLGQVAAALRAEEVPGLDRVPNWPAVTLHALDALARLRAAFATDPADEFVEKLRHLAGQEPLEAARFLGRHRVANLERFHRELIDLLAAGADAPRVARWLREGTSGERAVEQGTPGESVADAVRVLTMHAAKGLEFGHVYCAQLHRSTKNGTRPPTEVLHHADATAFSLGSAPGPRFAELVRARALREAAENRRLLYVAMTRAQRRLVLVGRPRSLARGSSHRDSLVDLLAFRDGEEPALDEWVGTPPAAAPERLRGVDATWVLPVRTRAAAGVPDDLDRARPRDGVEEIAAQAARLEAARAGARLHAARRLIAPASAASHEALDEVMADGLDAGARARPAATPSPGVLHRDEAARERGRRVGSAVHRVLEQVDLEADGAIVRAHAVEIIAATIATLGGDEVDAADALQRVERFLVPGGLRDRLRACASEIVARELPILASPAANDRDPVGAVVGTIDLLYRDRESGLLVVADWKTDHVDRDALAPRVLAYRAQATTYVEALRKAGVAGIAPHVELWFLHPGEVVRIDLPQP